MAARRLISWNWHLSEEGEHKGEIGTARMGETKTEQKRQSEEAGEREQI